MKSSFEKEIKENGYLVYKSVGTSMRPLIKQDRDILVIKAPPKKCKKYDIVLYKTYKKYILHRVKKVNKNDYVICGDNCIHNETGITDKHIIGCLSSIERKNKSISVDSIWMKIYSRIWCGIIPLRYIYIIGKKVLWKIKNIICTH